MMYTGRMPPDLIHTATSDDGRMRIYTRSELTYIHTHI